MATRNFLIRLAASVLYILRYRTLRAGCVRIIVFTGTAGKTLARTATAHALRAGGKKVVAPAYGYTNELGILLAVLGIERPVVLHSLRGLATVLFSRPTPGSYVLIELGADWRSDISWFSKRFTPAAVAITDVSTEEWGLPLEAIWRDKRILIGSLSDDGHAIWSKRNPSIEAIETLPIPETKTIQFTVESTSDGCVAISILGALAKYETSLRERAHVESVGMAIAVCSAEGVSLSQDVFSSYAPPSDRFKYQKLTGGAFLLSDTYKAVPYCMREVLTHGNALSFESKIAIVSDMHPLWRQPQFHYKNMADLLVAYDQVYLIGSPTFEATLKAYIPSAVAISPHDIPQLLKEKDTPGTLIVLKTAGRYGLTEILETNGF